MFIEQLVQLVDSTYPKLFFLVLSQVVNIV